MKTRRVISIYDLVSDKLINEISIQSIPIQELREILNVDKNDFDVYQIYAVSNEQLSMFAKYIPELSDFITDNIETYVECFQNQ